MNVLDHQEPTLTGVRVRCGSPCTSRRAYLILHVITRWHSNVNDAHIIFYAVAQGTLPMIKRRLSLEERAEIRAGNIYVWEERATEDDGVGMGIERWTDGVKWGPSRAREVSTISWLTWTHLPARTVAYYTTQAFQFGLLGDISTDPRLAALSAPPDDMFVASRSIERLRGVTRPPQTSGSFVSTSTYTLLPPHAASQSTALIADYEVEPEDPSDETIGVGEGGSETHQTQHFSLFDDLTRMKTDPSPTTQVAVNTIRRFARTACMVRRNTQTLFNVISAARDACEIIHGLIHQCDDMELNEDQRWMAYDTYTANLDELERFVDSNRPRVIHANKAKTPAVRNISRWPSVMMINLGSTRYAAASRYTWARCNQCNKSLLRDKSLPNAPQSDLFEATVRLATTIYSLRAAGNAESDEHAWKPIAIGFDSVGYAIASGDRLKSQAIVEEDVDTLSSRPLPPEISPGPDAPVPQEIQGLLIPEEKYHLGAYADVWRGKWTPPGGTEISVAIKYLRCVKISVQMSNTPDALAVQIDKRLRREVCAWEKLSNPNVTPVLGFRSGAEPLLITPYYENGNLDQYLRKHPTASKLKLLLQTASGLLYLHTLSPVAVHGNIHPENVLVNSDGEASLCDCGLARFVQMLKTGFTTSGKVGKGFTAPELLDSEGEEKSTMESDVYAFGSLMLHTLSGKPPFYHKSVSQTITEVCLGRTVPKDKHPNVDPKATVWTLMQQCWQMQPQIRPTMKEVYDALQAEEKHFATMDKLELEGAN
ncbi:hypothetical protein FRB98_006644 [Tulasnella sp. 332]|nr:hypothetical protein FRB98_006644 [Tulasnella sp. 332]